MTHNTTSAWDVPNSIHPGAFKDPSPCVKVVGFIKNNRVQMFFNEKPPADIRKQLKSSGFRWSPSACAWQRHLSNAAQYHAEKIAKSFSEEQ